jgi:hypothetical protein
MKSHISISFFGEYRPLHVEGEDLAACYKTAIRKLPESIAGKLRDLFKDFTRQRKAGISLVSSCLEAHTVAVRVADYPRDPWLDEITATMPPHPEIQY